MAAQTLQTVGLSDDGAVLDINIQLIARKSGDGDRDAVRVLVGLLDIVGGIGLRFLAHKIVEPVEAALRVVPPADLSVLRDVPGVNYSDNRIDFTAKNFQEAYDGVIGTIRVATRAYPQILREIVSEQPNGEQLLLQYNERLYDRWLDYESGRWQPEQQSSPSTPRKYFGAR